MEASPLSPLNLHKITSQLKLSIILEIFRNPLAFIKQSERAKVIGISLKSYEKHFSALNKAELIQAKGENLFTGKSLSLVSPLSTLLQFTEIEENPSECLPLLKELTPENQKYFLWLSNQKSIPSGWISRHYQLSPRNTRYLIKRWEKAGLIETKRGKTTLSIKPAFSYTQREILSQCPECINCN